MTNKGKLYLGGNSFSDSRGMIAATRYPWFFVDPTVERVDALAGDVLHRCCGSNHKTAPIDAPEAV